MAWDSGEVTANGTVHPSRAFMYRIAVSCIWHGLFIKAPAGAAPRILAMLVLLLSGFPHKPLAEADTITIVLRVSTTSHEEDTPPVRGLPIEYSLLVARSVYRHGSDSAGVMAWKIHAGSTRAALMLSEVIHGIRMGYNPLMA